MKVIGNPLSLRSLYRSVDCEHFSVSHPSSISIYGQWCFVAASYPWLWMWSPRVGGSTYQDRIEARSLPSGFPSIQAFAPTTPRSPSGSSLVSCWVWGSSLSAVHFIISFHCGGSSQFWSCSYIWSIVLVHHNRFNEGWRYSHLAYYCGLIVVEPHNLVSTGYSYELL